MLTLLMVASKKRNRPERLVGAKAVPAEIPSGLTNARQRSTNTTSASLEDRALVLCLSLSALERLRTRHQRSSKQHCQQRSKDLVLAANQDGMDFIWLNAGRKQRERERWFKLMGSRKTIRMGFKKQKYGLYILYNGGLVDSWTEWKG